MTNLQKRNLALCLALALLLVATALLAAVGIVTTPTVQAATTSNVDSYYANLNTDLTGEAFRLELQDFTKKGHDPISYNDLWSVYDKVDRDPDNNNNILLFYSSESRKYSSSNHNGVNREHVWAQSLGNFGTSNAGADGHHLMPCDSSLNNKRGNRSFDDVDGVSGSKMDGCYYNSSYFCPPNEYKGVVARILMYVQVRWGSDNVLKFADYATKSKANAIGKISTLLKWHFQYPPTQREIDRNTAVQEIQGNRNPFVDHPEYAALIYGYKGGYYVNDTTATNAIAAVDKYYYGSGDSKPIPEEKYVSYVSVSGTIANKSYTAGDRFNPTALTVNAIYSDGSTKDVDVSECKWLDATTGIETLSTGTTKVVCRYGNADSTAVGDIVVVNAVDGEKSITINRTLLPSSGAYNWFDWTVNGISGQVFCTCSGNTKDRIQMNSNTSAKSRYFYNTTPLVGGIRTLKITGTGQWELRVAKEAYTQVNGYPETGSSQEEKTIDNTSATWTILGNYEYFTLNYTGTGVVYVDEIVITYGATSGESGVTDSVKLDKLSARVKIGDTVNVGATASGTAAYVSSDVNVATVDSQGNIKAIGKGVATITVTCGTAKAQFLVVVSEQGSTVDPAPTPTPDPTPTPSPDDSTDEYPPIGCFGVVSAGGICAMMFAVMAAFVATKKR